MNYGEPLVSVCIPCYNAEKTIAATLDSILAQTYANIEIIVSDNQSTDKTRDVVRSYESKGVKLVENPPIVEGDGRIFGAFDNWDYALSQGKGEFLCLYHADDLYDSEIVEKEAKFLIESEDVGAVFTLKKCIDIRGKEICVSKWNEELVMDSDKIYNLPLFLENLCLHHHFVSSPTLMVKSDLLESIGEFNEKDYRSAADLDYWLRISEKYGIGLIKERLHEYRLSDTHFTAVMNSSRIVIADYFTVMDHYITKYRGCISEQAYSQYNMFLRNDMARCAWHSFLKNDCCKSKEMIRKVFSYDWIVWCLKSFHGVKVLGASIVVYVGCFVKRC